MRIAMVAPLIESVPPRLYGGTERVVAVLTDELVRRGHDVTLFASGDSCTNARLVPCASAALRLSGENERTCEATISELRLVYDRAGEFDIVHNHVDWLAFPFARLSPVATLTTVHGRLDLSHLRTGFLNHPEQMLVSISDAQRLPLPRANWISTVYNGIDLCNFHFRADAGDYLVFLGRISPEKGPDRAIEIAERMGMRLIIAAKVDPEDAGYYETCIRPMILASRRTEFVGEVTEPEKDQLLRNAYAYLFPIDWPEPFGLTMIESMATGTPVIAHRGGSVDEVVVHGETGFICDSVDEMVDAVAMVPELSRQACRNRVERRFSAAAMADAYEDAYRLALGCRVQRSR